MSDLSAPPQHHHPCPHPHPIPHHHHHHHHQPLRPPRSCSSSPPSTFSDLQQLRRPRSHDSLPLRHRLLPSTTTAASASPSSPSPTLLASTANPDSHDGCSPDKLIITPDSLSNATPYTDCTTTLMPVSGPDSKARNETRQTGVVDISHTGSTMNVNMDNLLTHQDPIMTSRQVGSSRAEEEKAYEYYSPSKGGVTRVNSQQQRAGIGSEPGPNRNSPVIKSTQPSSLPSSSVYRSSLSLSHDERSLDDMKRSRVIRGHYHQNRRSQSEHPGGDLGFAEKEQPGPGNGRTNDDEGNGRYDRSMLQVPTVENSMGDKLDQRPESCDISTLNKLFAEARRVEKYAEYCQQRSRSTDPAVIASFRLEMRERAQVTMSSQMDDKSQDDVGSNAATEIDTGTTTRPSFEHSTQARADVMETPRDRTRTSTTSTGPMIVDSNMVRLKDKSSSNKPQNKTYHAQVVPPHQAPDHEQVPTRQHTRPTVAASGIPSLSSAASIPVPGQMPPPIGTTTHTNSSTKPPHTSADAIVPQPVYRRTSTQPNFPLPPISSRNAAEHSMSLPHPPPYNRNPIPTAPTSTTPPQRKLSTTVDLEPVNITVRLPGMQQAVTFRQVPQKRYTILPDHRPPLRRDKPVRVMLPGQVKKHEDEPEPAGAGVRHGGERLIFPAVDRSFIFIPREMRPNQRGGGIGGRGRGRGRSSGGGRFGQPFGCGGSMDGASSFGGYDGYDQRWYGNLYHHRRQQSTPTGNRASAHFQSLPMTNSYSHFIPRSRRSSSDVMPQGSPNTSVSLMARQYPPAPPFMQPNQPALPFLPPLPNQQPSAPLTFPNAKPPISAMLPHFQDPQPDSRKEPVPLMPPLPGAYPTYQLPGPQQYPVQVLPGPRAAYIPNVSVPTTSQVPPAIYPVPLHMHQPQPQKAITLPHIIDHTHAQGSSAPGSPKNFEQPHSQGPNDTASGKEVNTNHPQMPGPYQPQGRQASMTPPVLTNPALGPAMYCAAPAPAGYYAPAPPYMPQPQPLARESHGMVYYDYQYGPAGDNGAAAAAAAQSMLYAYPLEPQLSTGGVTMSASTSSYSTHPMQSMPSSNPSLPPTYPYSMPPSHAPSSETVATTYPPLPQYIVPVAPFQAMPLKRSPHEYQYGE